MLHLELSFLRCYWTFKWTNNKTYSFEIHIKVNKCHNENKNLDSCRRSRVLLGSPRILSFKKMAFDSYVNVSFMVLTLLVWFRVRMVICVTMIKWLWTCYARRRRPMKHSMQGLRYIRSNNKFIFDSLGWGFY